MIRLNPPPGTHFCSQLRVSECELAMCRDGAAELVERSMSDMEREAFSALARKCTTTRKDEASRSTLIELDLVAMMLNQFREEISRAYEAGLKDGKYQP